ncbi:hepatocyte growth factor receptor-like isoform X2 [Oppia nitens]|uniref:hepatocyte growth factor receptor-like isoform X2 n=1 Tax=Oppia nitens TaxID=1686743 RepID=UPI0023DC6D8F|nr:hepatocyte growth factor receptor-like isoform X2 [Oppia nitens]
MNIYYIIPVADNKRTNNGCIIHPSLIVIKFILLLLSLETRAQVSVPLKTIRNMQITTLNNNTPAFRVVVNRDNNEVIVGARNFIYKLSPNNLEIIEEYRTGPVNDHIECYPPPHECHKNRRLIDNDNQVLLFNYDNKQYPILLACGTAYQGMCYLFKSSNISGYHLLYGGSQLNETLNYVSSRTSSVAFFAPFGNRKSDLYVANAYDGRPIEMSPPTLSSRKMTAKNNGFTLSHDSDAAFTKVDFVSSYKQTFNVKYIYGFNHSIYSYFVSTQPLNTISSEYGTKLIRVCHKDNDFFSYMEIPLKCSSNASTNLHKKDYFVVTAAYLGQMGSKNNKKLDTSDSNADALFLSMGVPSMATVINKTLGTVICGFSLRHINRAFTNAAKECFSGQTNDKVYLSELILGQKQDCRIIQSDVRDDFCGTGLNRYIVSNRELDGVLLKSVNGLVTSLATDVHNDRTVAAIGTDDGIIKKIILDDPKESEEIIFEMNVSTHTSKDRSIRPNPAFDSKRKNLYFLSDNQVIQFPFGSCSLHTDCASCLSTVDPLKCGWCGSYCATTDECDNPELMSNVECPPEIDYFVPNSGPTRGGTVITIIGHNLGTKLASEENSKINITIADTECDVVSWNMTLIECRTKSVPKEVFGKINIKVHSLFNGQTHGRNFDIKGVTESGEYFKFLEPQLLGINPSYGPIDGGTNVTLVGTNLLIGSNRRIFLAGVECKEFESENNDLSCTSGRQSSPSTDTSIKLFIDSFEYIVNQNKTITKPSLKTSNNEKVENSSVIEWSEYFSYKPNPKITKYSPKATIKSGKTNFTVFGENLNSVAKPKIMITSFATYTKETIVMEGQCWTNKSGTSMSCQTPSLNDNLPTPKKKIPIEAQLRFILDGVKHTGLNAHTTQMIYYPNPIFDKFENNISQVYENELIVTIKGKDLSTEYPIDIQVGQHICKPLDTKNYDEIRCQIMDNHNFFNLDTKHEVIINVGLTIHFSPGLIEVVPKHVNPLGIGLIMVIVFTVLILCAIIVFGVVYRKRFLNNNEKPPLQVIYNATANDSGSSDSRPAYVSQPSFNDYIRGESTHLLSVERRYQVSEETMALLRSEHIYIDRNNLRLEYEIGKGQFGCVYKGILSAPEKDAEREVAAKTLHNSNIRDGDDVESFLQEGLMMKDFKHHNVLTLIGVCFEDEGTPIVVLPYMLNGDLLSYIRNENNNPTVKTLLLFAIDIAKGMDYLSSQKFVHRDLAARNCMLDSDLCVKVADFGLSRDIYERDYYSSDNKKCKLPVKWMSPESLEKGTYNTKTDVWSYGVLVWELLTRGVTPYPDVDNWEILNYLKQSRRMPRPAYCPELLYFNVLLRCWCDDSRQRPTFEELVYEIESLIAQLEKSADKQQVDLDKCNTYINYPINTYYNELQVKPLKVYDDNIKPQTSSTYETTC